MAIANLTERMLFCTLQKSSLNLQLSNIQMTQLAATRQASEAQMQYNKNLQALYYDPNVGHDADPDAYVQYLIELQSEHELEMANLTAWESQVENEKEQVEAKLAEITQYENSWQSLLKNNIQKDFQYGGKSSG